MRHDHLWLMLIALLVPCCWCNGMENEEVPLPARESHRMFEEKWPGGENNEFAQYTKITVAPKELPYPLLRYRLNTYVTEWESGNAAPLYSQAYADFYNIEQNTLRWQVYQSDEYAKAKWEFSEDGNVREREDQLPIDKLLFQAFPLPSHWGNQEAVKATTISADDETQFYQRLNRVFHLIEKGSKKRDCDWGYMIEHQGIATLLPHLQEMRGLARFLQGKANWEIRNGKYDDALKTIRLGLRMAEHLKKSDTQVLVNLLVGIAIDGIMFSEVRHLMTQPDAPNLYPALTQLNFDEMMYRHALQAEQYWLFSNKSLQEHFEKIARGNPTKEECKEAFDEMALLFLLAQDINQSFANDYKENWSAVICLACYPFGKDRLLTLGKTEEEIEALSVYQVVAPYVLEEIKAAYDTMLVADSFPVDGKYTSISYDELEYCNWMKSPARIYNALLLPAVSAAKRAFNRDKQQLELLKITEAISLYASLNDGKVPESLEVIDQMVYVNTIDPITNKKYEYHVEGNTAIIDYSTHGPSRLEVAVDKNQNNNK